MKCWPFVLCVLGLGCTVAPAEIVSEQSAGPHISASPLTTSEAARTVRPIKLQLPDDEVGGAVRGLIEASERLVGSAAAARKQASMLVVRDRPAEVVKALEHAYDMLAPSDYALRWQVASTTADLGADEALDLLVKIANEPVPEAAIQSPASGAGAPSINVNATRQTSMTVGVAVDGIAKLARAGSTTTKSAARDRLTSYFAHSQRFVREIAVVGFLRGQTNLAAAKTALKPKIAAADWYMLDMTWGKDPSGVKAPSNPSAKPGDTRVVTAVPSKK